MEIEVGEWVRTKKGYIGKVIKIRERIETYKNDREAYLVDWNHKRATYISQIKDIKHSNNIIDLIQEGDYVNGTKVLHIMNGFAKGTMEIELSTHKTIYRNDIKVIKSIVTKEQFKSIEYKLED